MSTGPPACGWLRGTSRTSPGPPRRRRRPIRLRSTSARGRGFAAYLSACGGQPLQRSLRSLRQGGLRSLRSASSLSFLVILLPQNNSLTFVRGADRAYCAPRKWSWRPTKARLYRQPHAPQQRRFAALSTFPASPATVVFCRRYRLSMYIIPENHRNAQTIKPSSLAQIRNPPGRYHASFPSKRISHSRRKREGVIPVFC